MPNIKSAKKRMELSRKAAVRNKAQRSRLRTAVKRVREAKGDQAEERLRQAISLLDRAAQDRLFHPNRVDRIKGQLARHVNTLKAS